MAVKNVDGVLGFVEWAREALAAAASRKGEAAVEPGWAWMMTRVLFCCRAYPRGLTEAILLSELFQSWAEKERVEGSGKNKPNLDWQSKRKDRSYLPNVATIDSILEKRFVALDAVMEVVVLDIHLLPGTSTYLLTLGDIWSNNTVDHYLHRKFYEMVQGEEGVLRKGREIRLTNCRLRAAMGFCQPRLLPTEYLVIVLDEEQDCDALLLGAQFCSDTFSSIQRPSVEAAVDYYLYARLEKSLNIETRGNNKHLKQRQLVLVDGNGDSVPLVLWDNQISLASLFSEGSMLAIEKPFVATDSDCGIKTASGLCLEFGSLTRLYLVPYIQPEEQVTIGSTQLKTGIDQEKHISSQFLLPRDSQGSVDFNRYPFRLLIEDLRPKTSHIALYGLVRSLVRFAGRHSSSKELFILSIEDHTGVVEIELRFASAWAVGEVYAGQTLFICGLSTFRDAHGSLKCSWTENVDDAFLVNVTRLTAVVSSPCLHCIVNISAWTSCGQACRVRLGKILIEQVQLKRVHSVCGQHVSDESGFWFCDFCQTICEHQTMYSFEALVPLFDVLEGSDNPICVLLLGEAALSILQVSADSFCTWPEDERAIYLFSLEGEEYIISFYRAAACDPLRIGCAVKWER